MVCSGNTSHVECHATFPEGIKHRPFIFFSPSSWQSGIFQVTQSVLKKVTEKTCEDEWGVQLCVVCMLQMHHLGGALRCSGNSHLISSSQTKCLPVMSRWATFTFFLHAPSFFFLFFKNTGNLLCDSWKQLFSWLHIVFFISNCSRPPAAPKVAQHTASPRLQLWLTVSVTVTTSSLGMKKTTAKKNT